MPTIRLSGVCERDIDLLLLEEFVASPVFLRWFLESVNIPEYDDLVSAEQSVTTSNGQSDLELSVSTSMGVVKALIEDKVEVKRRLGRSPDRGDAVVLAAIRTPIIRDNQTGERAAVRAFGAAR